MAVVQSLEKPGRINGEKPKRILNDAGNKLDCMTLFKDPWIPAELVFSLLDVKILRFLYSHRIGE